MFSEFHFLQFSYFFSWLYLPLDTLVFFPAPVFLCLFPSFSTCYQYHFLYPRPPHLSIFQFLRLDAQFFCLSQSDNLSQYLWTKFTFPSLFSYFYSRSFALRFTFLLFSHFFSPSYYTLSVCSRLLTVLSLSVVASSVAAVVPQPQFPHNCGSLCGCNFVSMIVFADAAAQAHRIFDGNTSSRGY